MKSYWCCVVYGNPVGTTKSVQVGVCPFIYCWKQPKNQTQTKGRVPELAEIRNFGEASKNKEPTISFTEFVSATLDFDKYMTPLWVGKAFDTLNSQGLGFVEAERRENSEGAADKGCENISHVRNKSGVAAEKISKMMYAKGKDGMSRDSIIRMIDENSDLGGSRDKSGKSVVGANIAFLDHDSVGVRGDVASIDDDRMVARMSRQSLIDLVCEATALQVSDAKSSSMGIVKLKQAQRSVPPDIDEPCSSGDEHETEYNAEAKLEADLAFFAQRMSSAKGRSSYQ